MSIAAKAQLPNNYWQQEVHYTVNVTLNDSLNTLDANIRIVYINHSPDTLQEIYMHLWPNAYKDNTTAFARQMEENGNTSFYFCKDTDRGYIDSLHFKTNGNEVKWAYDKTYIDIAKLYLSTPLKHDDSVIITTPFHVKIPYTFSRFGHVGQAYQITQWYPKPAVYDATGWHQFPYLNQGEFYSEFGSFNVSITLPSNYIVAATGDLQNESEKKRLDSLSEVNARFIVYPKSMIFPRSSKKIKTLQFIQHNVHDFAWFADKRFNVAKNEVILKPENHTVTTWCFFLNSRADIWRYGIKDADSAIRFYSRNCINYPYNQVSVVQGALDAGDGMEYPNVCVISGGGNATELEDIIIHEIGHNWFYGMLGSNERDDPWMDEGINSYYEFRYMESTHPDLNLASDYVGKGIARFFDLNKYPYVYSNYLVYKDFAARHLDQPCNLTSSKYTELNYFLAAYCKPVYIFRYLDAYLGRQTFDSIMKKYVHDWQYKHPHPDDVKNEFVNFTHKNLDAFFDDELKTTKHLDYKIISARDTEHIGNSVYTVIKVKNTGQIKGPYSISAIRHDSIIYTIWYGGVFGTIDVLFPKINCDAYKIDAYYDMPEIDQKNNTISTKGIFRHMEPLRLQLGGSIDDPDRTQLFYLPIAGYNFYDKAMVGLAFYNHLLPTKRFEYTLAPFYAFGTRTFTGMGRTDYYFYPATAFQQIDFRLSAEKFDYSLIPQALQFEKYQAALFFNIRKKDLRSTLDEKLYLRVVNTYTDFPFYTSESNYYIFNNRNYYSEANFAIQNTRPVNPYFLNVQLQQGPEFSQTQFVKLVGHAGYRINYNKANTYLDLNASAGKFLYNGLGNFDYVYSFHLSANTGIEDYLYDDIFIGRSQETGFLAQQIMSADNTLKVVTAQNPGYGDSNNDYFMVNVKTTLPFTSPIFLFADIGSYNKLQYSTYETLIYDGGIGLSLGRFITIYYPLFYSYDLKTEIVVPEYQNPLERIVFTINFVDPFNFLRRIGS